MNQTSCVGLLYTEQEGAQQQADQVLELPHTEQEGAQQQADHPELWMRSPNSKMPTMLAVMRQNGRSWNIQYLSTGLAVHQEKDQRVYVSTSNAIARAQGPSPVTMPTALLKLCKEDDYAKMLKYADVQDYYTWGTKRSELAPSEGSW